MHNSSATVLAVLSFRFCCSCNRGLSGVHTAHDIVRQRWMPWRTMSDDIGRDDTGRHNDIVRCRPMSSDNFYMQIAMPCWCRSSCDVTMSYDIVRHWRRNWTKFSFCVSVVAATYDIVRRRTTSSDVVRCRAKCEHRFTGINHNWEDTKFALGTCPNQLGFVGVKTKAVSWHPRADSV